MLSSKSGKLFYIYALCSMAYVQTKKLLFEKVDGNVKCQGSILNILNASPFVCMSKCNAEPRCSIVNVMEQMEKCELLSSDGMLPAKKETFDGWSCYQTPVMGSCPAVKESQIVIPCPVLGTTKCMAARSCLHISTSCPTYVLKSGLYWIQGPNAAIQMFCDMETDAGGWTKVANANTTSSSFPRTDPFFADDITQLDRVISDFFTLSTQGLDALRRLIGFTQIRIFCFKESKSTVHIATSKSQLGLAVVDYMTGRSNTQPPAFGSCTALPDDSSNISKLCSQLDPGNVWGHKRTYDRLYYYPLSISSTNNILPGSEKGWFDCDGISQGQYERGVWMYFVR